MTDVTKTTTEQVGKCPGCGTPMGDGRMTLSMYEGPADGQDFFCSRAPRLLRVVQAQSGKWDCLDQREDEPRPTETIHLYELVRAHTGAFICPGGYSADGTYRHVVSCRFRSKLDATIRARGTWHQFVAAYFGIRLDRDGERLADIIPFPTRLEPEHA